MILCHNFITQHRRYNGIYFSLQQVTAEDYDRQAGRAHIFLGAGINQRMGRHINLATKDRAGPVGYQRNTAGLGQGIVAGAENGVVAGNM